MTTQTDIPTQRTTGCPTTPASNHGRLPHPPDASPDALAASSLSDGPVLVVPACDDLPGVVRDEIRRLGPAEVIALGGESSICDEIVRQATG